MHSYTWLNTSLSFYKILYNTTAHSQKDLPCGNLFKVCKCHACLKFSHYCYADVFPPTPTMLDNTHRPVFSSCHAIQGWYMPFSSIQYYCCILYVKWNFHRQSNMYNMPNLDTSDCLSITNEYAFPTAQRRSRFISLYIAPILANLFHFSFLTLRAVCGSRTLYFFIAICIW